jgi:arsenate reductase-like glutaredoxin family protein
MLRKITGEKRIKPVFLMSGHPLTSGGASQAKGLHGIEVHYIPGALCKAEKEGYSIGMIQIFGVEKNPAVRRALRFFKERRVETQFRDLSVKPPSPGELDDMAAALGGWEALVDTEGPAAKERGLAYLEYDSREELLRDPRLYRMPLVRAGRGRAALGVDEEAWKSFCP